MLNVFYSGIPPKRTTTILKTPTKRMTPKVSSSHHFLIGCFIVLLSWISCLGIIHANTAPAASETPIDAGALDSALPPIAVLGIVSVTIPLENGGILIGGSFTNVNGVTRNRIARLNPDGSLDLTFSPSFNNTVNSIHVFSNGSMLVAGDFTTLGEATLNRIVKLNPDGKPDPLFLAGTDGSVSAILAQPDGKVIIGGSFRKVNNVSQSFLARLGTDGSLDTSFNPNVTNPVLCLAPQTDGKIMVGGTRLVSGSSIARLETNGVPDTSFTYSSNNAGAVLSIVVAPDGKIMIGGSFTRLNGVDIRSIARLTASGTIDTAFVATATGGTVSSINLQADGKILVSGSFTSLNGEPRNRFGRLNPDGSLDTTNPIVAGSVVTCISLQSDGKLLLGGSFTTVNGETRRSFARLIGDPVTSVLQTTGSSTVRWVRGGSLPLESSVSFEIHESGAIGWRALGDAENLNDSWTLGGLSLPVAGIIRARAAINTREGGHPQTVWLPPFGVAEPAFVVRDSSGRQIQSSINPADFGAIPVPLASELELDVVNTGLADLEGISVTITGPAASDFSVSKFPDSKLQPTAISSMEIRFNPAAPGVRLAELAIESDTPGLNPFVISLTGSGGSVFSPLFRDETDKPLNASSLDFNGISFGSLVLRFAPSPGTCLIAANNTGANPISGVLTGLPDQGIIEAAFEGTTYRFITTYRGGDGNDLAFVLLSPGSVDPCFNPRVSSTVFALGLQKDGKIIAAGGFDSVGGVPRNRIARLNQDGTPDNSFIPALTVRGIIMLVQRDGRIIVESQVTDADGIVRSTLGRMNPDGSIDPSFSTRISGSVFVMIELRNGSILLGGNFSRIGTTNKTGIALLNSDGSLDTNFTTFVTTFANDPSGGRPPQVKALAELPDGKILVGGNFFYVNGSQRSYLARLNSDGTLDTSFNGSLTSPRFGEDGVTTCLAVQPDNRIIVGGYLTGGTGSLRNGIMRLNANGSVDPSFLASIDRQPECILLHSDGSLILGGPFSEVNGVKRNHLAKLNADGSLDGSYKPNQVAQPATIWSLLMERNGSVLLGGSFSSMNGVGAGSLARLVPVTGTSSLFADPNGEIIWHRSGAQADLLEVDIEFTGDQGLTWVPLGQATRTPEGWRFAGQLPFSQGIIRANGFQNLSNRSSVYTVETAMFGREATSIEQWRKLHFGWLLGEGISADLADADGDGLQNLMEFALGMDPRKDSSGLAPRWERQGSHYGLEFQKPLGVAGVDYTAEWSPTMAEGTWQPAEDLSSGNTIRFRVSRSGHRNLFFRLKAIDP